MKTTISEMKNLLEGINSRLDEAENRISKLEDKIQYPPKEKMKKRLKRNKECLRCPWDNIKYNNSCITGVPEGDECTRGTENLFGETVAENFSNLVKKKSTQVQVGQSPNKDELKETYTKTHHN